MVNNYLRHPAFQGHPVVGVTWKQAVNFAKWRTDRVNEQLLVSKGFLREGAIIPDSISDGYTFNTKAYLLDPESAYFKNGKLDFEKEMVLFCAGGLRSALAAKSLKDMGFEKISHIDGGFGAIRQSKFKII